MNADRNLVLGVLALQLDLIDQAQFVDACAAWAARKTTTLGDILVQRGWITHSQSAQLESLVADKVNEHGGDSHDTLRAMADREIGGALSQIDDDVLQRTFSYLDPDDSSEDRFVETSAFDEGELSHYALSRLHSTGGLGRVWIAHDKHLGRQVALKELRPDKPFDENTSRRFVREAQITGQLEHPNIVPVYELIHDRESGRPSYTMRFLRGQTFRRAIKDYHRKRKVGKAGPLELRRLLNAFIGVCNAIGFAHSKGVLHRDLKPDNIVLGAFGEVSLLDWGLAKATNVVDSAQPEQSQVDLSGNDPEATRQGRAIGTVRYMPPEQAQGLHQDVDERSDVFGLGAVLYSILCGHAPFRGTDPQAILKKVIDGPTPRSRDVLASVPAALDAICAKAMAKQRGDRYATAQQLADDVQHWLADEPVSVYSESLSLKLARLMRKHRAWTQATAVALVVVTVVAVAAAVVVDRARRREQAALVAEQVALDAERQAREEALQRFKESRATVDEYLTRMADVLKYYPGARQLRAKLLQVAAKDYERFIAERGNQFDIRLETARAWGRLGDVYQWINEYAEAEAAYQSALSALEELTPKRSTHDLDRAYCLAQLGDLYRKQQRYGDASREYSRALELAQASGGDAHYLQLRPRVLLKQALLCQQTEDFEAAIDLLKDAEAQFSELTRRLHDPQRGQYFEGAGKARAILGQVYVEQGRNDLAAVEIESAIASYEELTKLDADSVAYLEGLAFSRVNYANAIQPLAREHELQAALTEASKDYDRLLQTLPDVPQFRENRAIARFNLAAALHAAGRNTDAKEYLDRAHSEFFYDLWEPNRDQLQYYEKVVATAVLRAQVLLDLNEDEEAKVTLDGSIAAYVKDLIRLQPDESRCHRGLAEAYRLRAQLFYKLEKHDLAEQDLTASIARYEEAMRLSPHDPYAKDGLAKSQEQRGDLLRASGQEERSQQSYAAAAALRRQLQLFPEHRYRLAALLLKPQQEPETREAIRIAKELSDALPHSTKFLTLLGAAHCVARDFASSIEILTRVDQLPVPENSPHEFWLALATIERGMPGDLGDAQLAYERGKQRMDQHAPGKIQLIELRRQVEALLGAEAPTTGEADASTGPPSR